MNARKNLYCYMTSNPDYMGYGRKLDFTEWVNENPEKYNFRTTPGKFMKRFREEKRICGYNGGTYYTFAIVDKEGNLYSIDEIQEFENDREFEKLNRK